MVIRGQCQGERLSGINDTVRGGSNVSGTVWSVTGSGLNITFCTVSWVCPSANMFRGQCHGADVLLIKNQCHMEKRDGFGVAVCEGTGVGVWGTSEVSVTVWVGRGVGDIVWGV